MRDRTQRPELEQPIKPTPARAGATDAKRPLSTKLEVSPGVKELTGDADWSDASSRREVSYEVFLEQLAHDMAYEDKLSPDQQALLHRFGYTAAPSVDGPFGFQMRVFTPTKPDFPHPVIAFRGTEFTSGKDLQADLAPQGVGHNQFRANQRRIQTAIEAASRFGRIWVTGHSLGGALAQLTAATYSAAIGRVITFQSPSIDAYSVKQLEAYNRAHPDEQVTSTHYQVAGDVVSSAGERLTPGEVVQFELKPSDGSTAKTMTAGMFTGLLIGPGTGMSAAAAMEAIAKHRAFPVSNAAQEHPAFRELFEEGKTFERIAGISRDTFEARKPISSEIFKNSSTSNFLRFNIGRGVFAAEKAMSDWGKDAKAREWTIRNRDRIDSFTAPKLLEQLQALLDGWVSDEDVSAFEMICYGVRDPKIMVEIRAAIAPRLEELHSESQRRWIEDASRYQPKVSADSPVQRARLEGGSAEDLSVKPFSLSGGRALETAQRERLEAHAGINLETVRVFEGDEAAEVAAGYNAKAFTQGENIVLGKGVSLTDELARHETEHVKQQRESSLPSGVDPLHSAEDAAQTAARNYAQGQNAAAKTTAPLEPAKVSGSVQRLEGQPIAQTPITITFSGQSAREETFSAYSRTVLEDILRATGVSSCTITSTTRTPHDQARIFYQQLTGALAAASYAAAGEAVKAVGRAAIKAKKSRAEAIALMEASIRTYNPMSQVSKHLADPAVLNVFDVAPTSIPSRRRAAFVNAVNADARVNGFLHPGNSSDPAFHIQVPQGGATTPPATPPAPARAPTGRVSDAGAAQTPDSSTSTAPKNTSSSAVQRLATPAANPVSTWQDRLFAANIVGSDGNRRIDFTLDRQAGKISGSFAIHGTGRGNITKGSFDHSDKASPLKLECQFTDGELSGQTRVLEGWFLYAEGGTSKDENSDGKDDSSKAALPLLIGGTWKGGTKDYRLGPISPSAAKPGGNAWTYNSKSGNTNFTEEVAKEVLWAANELGVNPNDLAACISFESAGSFSPSQKNLNGGGAIGLIQFLPPSLNQMKQYLAVANGKSAAAKIRADEIQKYGWEAGKLNRASLMTMSVHEQMRYVMLHFKAHSLESGSGLPALYQKIIAPFSKADSMYVKGTRNYVKNRGLDADKDGIITAEEAASVIERNGNVREYFTPSNKENSLMEAQTKPNAVKPSEQTYTVTTMSLNKKVSVSTTQLSMQGAYPTALESIDFQPTRIVDPTTATALADVRGGSADKLERSAPQTATEFLASGTDYANLQSNGVYQVHTGWDLNVAGDKQLNKPAFCAADGVVVFTGSVSGFKKIIIVYHPQLQRWTRYAHVKSYAVAEGQIIKAGEQVGIIGNADNTQAPHLHFDVIKRLESAGMWNGVSRNDPRTKNDERDYNNDGCFDVNDRIEFVKDHYEDPQAFFAKVGVAIPEKK